MINSYSAPKASLVSLGLTVLFLGAGFSQIEFSGNKPVDFIIIIVFLIFILKGNLTLGVTFVFFSLSFVYAWIFGGFLDARTMISSFMIFSIVFSIIDYFRYRDVEELEHYLKLFLFSMFLSNGIAVFIFLIVPQFEEMVVDISSIGVRFRGFFSQANGYAYVLLLTLPIAIYFLKKRKSIFDILNVLLIIFCMILAQSRGAILSFLIGLFLVYFIFLFRSRKIGKIFLPVIFVALIGYLSILILPSFLEDNFGINLSRLNPTSEKASERSITDLGISNLEEDRFYLVNAGIETIKSYPFGLGYQPQHEVIGRLTGIFLIPHNYFLTLLLTYGIFVGFAWIFIILYLFFRGIRLFYKQGTTPRDLFFYLTAMMFMVGIFYLTHSSDWSYFYFLVAFYVVQCRIKVKNILG